MVLVSMKSPPAKKGRKITLKPLVVEKTGLQLLKPDTMDILEKEPYVSALFLHAFINLSKEAEGNQLDEKALQNHIIKGYQSVSYKQKMETCLEYKDTLFQDHNFRNKIMNRA